MKHTNEYLYGTDNVPTIANNIINKRIELLMQNLVVVNEEHYSTRDIVKRDAILKAIRFWSSLAKHNEDK